MNTPNKPFALSLTAQEVHEALLSVNNKIDKSNIAFNLLSASNETVPSTQAVLNALDVVSGDFSSLGALSQEDNIDLNTDKAVGILPISKGGTGTNTAAAARQALNVLTPTEIDERINSAIPEIQEVDLQGDKIINELPISRGGTGASSVGQARQNLGVDSSVRVTEKITEETWDGYLVGYFDHGFTYTSSEQVARGSDGKYYKYIGEGNYPIEVSAGTIASQNLSLFQEVKNIGYTIKDNEGFKQALLSEAGIIPNGLPDTVQSSQRLDALKTVVRKPLELKIFQSPTDNLTKISTFAGGVGVAYSVRKTSDNSLATIYSDKDGVTPIPQNGTANVSNGDAECVFYVADGYYTITINVVSVRFNANNAHSGRVQDIDELKLLPIGEYSVGDKIFIREYHTGSGYGSGVWEIVSGETANDIDIVQSTVSASIQFKYASEHKMIVGIGAIKGVSSATYVNRALELGGEWALSSGDYIIESQLNATADNTVVNCESRDARLVYSDANTGNLLAIKSKGFRFNGGTIDGDNLVALVGDAAEDGSLVCAVADTEFKFKDTLFANVLGDNSILGKQALLNINNQGVVFDLADCDFLNCRIKKSIESTKDSQFVSFKGNNVTNPTRGRIHGGSMIGVGVVLDSGVSTDKDGKCIRGYFNESSDVEFDIEVTGVYSTEFDEAFSKTTGMKGVNVHDNHIIGGYTQPWDGTKTKSEYFVRNTMISKSSGVTLIHNNMVRGIFNKLVEAKHSTSIKGNSFSIKDSASGHLDVLYEISEYGVDISDNAYELGTINKIFNFLGTPEGCSWKDEHLGFNMVGDEGAGLGKRLMFGTSDIAGFKASNITLDIATTDATASTDIIFLNSQFTNSNISGLVLEDFTVNTNNYFNYVPRISGNSAVIDGISYNNFAVKYTAGIVHGTTYALSAQNVKPKDISIDGFEVQYNGLTTSSTYSPINLDGVGLSRFKDVYIHDINSTGNTLGFLARLRGDAADRPSGLDFDGLTFKNMKSSQSRLVDITNQDNASFSNVKFLNTISTSTSLNGLQFTLCNNITVGDISANDKDSTTWTSMVKINSGDNYVVGKVNCRGVKATFGTATNVIDNT